MGIVLGGDQKLLSEVGGASHTHNVIIHITARATYAMSAISILTLGNVHVQCHDA